MNNIRVTTIQTCLHWENADANLAMLEEEISKIDSTDIIVLPEMFTTGFSMNAAALAEPMNFKTLLWLRNMAEKKNSLVLGSYIVKVDNRFYNRLIWMEPSGQLKTYDKRHLFRMGGEEKIYSKGSEILVAEWRGWKICPLVCYDLRFPVWSRNRTDAYGNPTYDLLVYVANWPASRIHHWQTLLRARAIENLSYVVGVNRVGTDGKEIEYCGQSVVIDPTGDCLYDAGNLEQNQTTELSSEHLKNWRKKFPAFMDGDDFALIQD